MKYIFIIIVLLPNFIICQSTGLPRIIEPDSIQIFNLNFKSPIPSFRIHTFHKKKKIEDSIAMPEQLNRLIISDSISRAYSINEVQAYMEYNNYLVFQYRHTQNVFNWQLISSRIIFVIVLLLVLSGIVLSWLQFARPNIKDSSGNPVNSSLKISFTTGIEVSSPILGIIILIISLAFFYMYLVEVYQIKLLN